MLSLDALIRDVDGSVRRRSGHERARTVARLTDLFVAGADGFGEEQVELFDAVIKRFAAAIETRARVELAERLSDLANGPRRTLLQLAKDEIVVARPVLSRSPRIDDQDLMAVAVVRGRDHMLAICERADISPPVSDILVRHGDGVVRHAITGNPGARFSAAATASLINFSRTDPALGELLGERYDLTPQQAEQLVAIAKEAARERLERSLPSKKAAVAAAVERGAADLRRSRLVPDAEYAVARVAIAALLDERPLSEADLVDFAGARRLAETISALSSMTGLPIAAVERVFEDRDNHLLIVIGKARGWSWVTVRMLLQLRDPSLVERHQFRRAEETFDTLASDTAGRVVHFLQVREGAEGGGRAEAGRHTRTKVR